MLREGLLGIQGGRDMYYIPKYTIGGYLCHHGILKQKWGVRNGPPYPLSYGAHTAAQKKANPKSVIGGDSTKIKKKREKEGLVVDTMTGELKNNRALRKAATRRFRMQNDYLLKPVIDKLDRKAEEKDHLVSQLNSFEDSAKQAEAERRRATSVQEKRQKINKEFPMLKKFNEQNAEDYWLDEAMHYKNRKEYPVTYSDLMKDIHAKSGDWYDGKGVTKEFQENRDQSKKVTDRMYKLTSYNNPDSMYKQTRDHKIKRTKNYENGKREYAKLRNEYTKLQDDLLGIVLSDLGYEDTRKNRNWIKPVVIND